MRTIGEKIRSFRLEKGLTQDHLAYLLSLSQTRLSRLEQGKAALRLDEFQRLTAIMDVSSGELLPETGPLRAQRKAKAREYLVLEQRIRALEEKLDQVVELLLPTEGDG